MSHLGVALNSFGSKAIAPGARCAQRLALACLALALAGMALAGPAQADRPITPRFIANAKGDLVQTGNTLMTCPLSAPTCASARDGSATGSDSNNNSYAMEYVDVDADPSTFNSSTAGLTLPAGAEVLFAGLYYSGNTAAGGEPERATTLLNTPAPGGYLTVTADQIDDFNSSDPTQHIYGGFADITALVTAGGSGNYTVANVQAEQGSDHHAGWGIVVAYHAESDPPRNLTVFDGLQGINPNEPDESFTLSGFQTTNSGPVNADVGFLLWEGDKGLLGDEVLLDGTPLSDANNPATNFNNSTISFGGSLFTAKTPNYANQLGYDNDVINADGLLANNQTSATLTLRTTGDRWVHQVITFAPDILSPDVDLQKTAEDVDGGALLAGDEVEYTVTGTNNGQEAAADLTLVDAIPAGTTYVPGSLEEVAGANAGAKSDAPADDQAELAAGPDRARFRLGTGADAIQGGLLAPGEDFEVSFRVRIAPATPPQTTITNVATADYSGETSDIAYSVDSNPAEITTAPEADLSVTKTAPSPAQTGNQLTFTLVVANDGPSAATGVVVSDQLPAGIGFVSANPSQGACGEAAGLVTCNLGAIADGAAAQITIVTTVDGQLAGDTITNTAEVDGVEQDPDPSNNSDDAAVDLVSGPGSLADVKTVKTITHGFPRVGNQLTYRIAVSNLGPDPATDVNVVDTLDGAVELVSVSTSGGSCSSTLPVTCSLGRLFPGDSVEITVVVKVLQAGRLANVASATSPETDPAPDNNSDDAIANVAAERTRVTLKKVATVKKIVPNQRFAYKITFTNLGPGPAVDVRVCDLLPKQLRFVGAPGGGVYDPARREVCWAADSVAPGASLQLRLNVRANRTLPRVKKIRNLVIATGSNFPEAKAAAYINCGTTITQ
jgi:uncharacterized repeat protein (TIGR01451 family)